MEDFAQDRFGIATFERRDHIILPWNSQAERSRRSLSDRAVRRAADEFLPVAASLRDANASPGETRPHRAGKFSSAARLRSYHGSEVHCRAEQKVISQIAAEQTAPMIRVGWDAYLCRVGQGAKRRGPTN